MHRASPALIALRAVDAAKTYLPFMLLQGSVAERLPGWAQLPWLILVWYYSLSRIQVLFFDWLTTRFAVTDAGIAQQAGWPVRSLTQARWSDIGAVQVDQDLSHRLLGRYRVRAVVGGDGRDAITLEALDAAAVERINDLHRRNGTDICAASLPAADGMDAPALPSIGPTSADLASISLPDAGRATGASRLIYRASWPDKVLISFTHGLFLLVVPLAIGAYSDLAELVGLPSGVWLLEQVLAGAAGSVATAVLAAFTVGFAHAAVRYHHYEVHLGDALFTATGGLLNREARQSRVADVRGVRISQNPLMRVLGCASLRLVLANARGEFRSLVVLPAASIGRVRALADELLPGRTLPSANHAVAPASYGWWIAAVTVPAAAGIGCALTGLPWVAALCGSLGVVLGNVLWARLDLTDSGLLLHRRGLLTTCWYALELPGVRSLQSWSFAAPDATRLTRVAVMDRRPVGLWSLAPSVLDDALTERLSPTPEGAIR